MTRHAAIVIIGAGTAGLTALKEAQRHTDDVLLINAGAYGTTCARVGCMPSKALLEVAHGYARKGWLTSAGIEGLDPAKPDLAAVMAHVRSLRDRFIAGPIALAESLGRRSIQGAPRFIDAQSVEVNGERIGADVFVLATGTRPIMPADWRALGDRIVTSDDVFELRAPGQRIGVVGLGPIGVELGQAFAQLGCDVHGFTRDTRLAGLKDPEVNAGLVEALSPQMTITTEADVSVQASGDGVRLESNAGHIEVDWVLAALGRRPNIDGLGLENLGVEIDARGMPDFDPQTLQVGDLPIYMAGDLNAQRPLMHEAADAGRMAAYHALHPKAECLARRTPLAIVFTDPGAGRTGLAYDELPENGVVVGTGDFSKQARALMAGRNAGRLHLYVRVDDGVLLGAEAVIPDAEHLLHLLAWAIEQRLGVDRMLQMPLYHPTIEEGLRGALQSARRQLGERRSQPDLPLCRDAPDWALG